jgi:hypothetical protein
MLNDKTLYLRIAFNRWIDEVKSILPIIPRKERIIIDAGTHCIIRDNIRSRRQDIQEIGVNTWSTW